MRLNDLMERRAVLVAEMRSLTSKPAGDGGDLSAEQAQRFDMLKGEIEGLERTIERQRVLDDAERRMQGQPLGGSGDTRFDEQCREFSLRAAIAGAAGMNVEWGREREISAELARRSGRTFQGVAVPMAVFERRVITTTTPISDPGSNLIGTDHRGDLFIDRLQARMVVRRLGARVLTGLVGNVDIPKLKESAVVGWVAENSALPTSDLAFAKVQLAPKHCGGITEFSRNMLLQSSPDIEQIIRSDFAQVLAQALDRAAIKGGGANEPDGVLEQGIDTTVSMGGGPTWATVLELIERVQLENAEGAGFVATPRAVRLLRSTPKVADTDSVMLMESPDSLAGYPLVSTTNVPGTVVGSPTDPHALIFGDWSDLLIGFWSELDILVNPYESAAYSKGNVMVRGMMTVDIAVRHSESFAAAIDITP
jgi:HK97 family phage major capsid protein